MSEITAFPERGVIRDGDGNVVGAYSGMSKDAAKRQMAHQVRAMTLAHDLAKSLGYDNVLEMPEDERMKLFEQAAVMTEAANDESI